MLSDAIEYPLEGDDAVPTLAIGGALSLASSALGVVGVLLLLVPLVGWVLGPLAALVGLVPTVLLGGYSVAVSRSVMDGRPEPPRFTDWEQYFRDGLALLGIAVVYSLPGIVLVAVGGLLATVAPLLPEGVAVILVLLVVYGGAVIAPIYQTSFMYVFPAAMVNYARTGELNAAWDVDTLRAVLTDRDYALAWGLATVVLLAASSAGSSLTLVLVGFAVLFYGQVAAVYLFTRGAAGALDVSTEWADSPTAPDGDSAGGECDGADDGNEPDDAEEDADGTVDEPDALEDVAGVGPATAEALRAAGYETIADLREASREELTGVERIGPAKADQIKSDVDQGHGE